MTPKTSRAEKDLINTVADRYRSEGYRVSVQPASDALPDELQGFQPDLVAHRGDERVIVEVKRGISTGDLPARLDRITERARALGWRVDLVSEPEPSPSAWTRSRRQELQDSALLILDEGHKEAAVLLASAALEAALRLHAKYHNLAPSERSSSVRRLIDELQSRGILGSETSRLLSRLAEARNYTAHGLAMGRISSSELRDALEVARWLDSADFATPDEMADWFFEHFEDPAEWVPYDTAEGGYQYPGGEPHDAYDVLRDRYADAPEPVILDAVDLIAPLGLEWVSKETQRRSQQ